ncbi:MAG TPA: MlaD family protein [Candidatus Binataceae bacterium]|nr:MlaD family protein [Candidatus Binataceae bacterium]
MSRHRGAWNIRIVRPLLLAAALMGCAANPNYYGATFNQPDGLGPGDPVRHGGTQIGSVTTISNAGSGGAQVSVQIDPEYASAVYVDSILVLQGAGSSPSLELFTPGAESSKAADGALLYGASNDNQTQMLTTILGPEAIGNSYAQFINRYAPGQAVASPGASVLQNQLVDIFRQTIAATSVLSSSSPAGRAQMDQFLEDADVVERQLDAHGQTAQASQVRAQVAQMNAAAAAAGASPNALTIPKAAPTP